MRGWTAQKHLLENFRALFRLIPPFFLFPQMALFGQALHLSSATASPGERVTIEISFKSPRGTEPSALQWETTIPSAQLAFLDDSMTAGPAAQAAGKSVNCAVKTKTGEAHTSVCILYGGQDSIHDGVVAILRLKIPPDARPGTARIRVDQGLAVSKDLKRYPLDPAESVVKVRPQ